MARQRGQGFEAMARHLQERGARDHQRTSACGFGALYLAGAKNLREVLGPHGAFKW